MDYSSHPATRAEAKALGLKHYFTGKPCSKGHVTGRHLTGTCIMCQQDANKRWALNNPGAANVHVQNYIARYPERARATRLRSKRKAMGIPDAPYTAPSNCELCSRELVQGKTHLDHDHTTGKFRGWLCNRCNLGLGNLGDTIAGVERALAYLRRTGSS